MTADAERLARLPWQQVSGPCNGCGRIHCPLVQQAKSEAAYQSCLAATINRLTAARREGYAQAEEATAWQGVVNLRGDHLHRVCRICRGLHPSDPNPERFTNVGHQKGCPWLALSPTVACEHGRAEAARIRPDGSHRCIAVRDDEQCRRYLDHTGEHIYGSVRWNPDEPEEKP